MTPPRFRALVPALVVTLAVPVWSAAASASPDPLDAGHHAAGVMTAHASELATVALSPMTDEAGLPWSALLAAVMASVLAWCHPRRALVLALILLLAIFAFESGL